MEIREFNENDLDEITTLFYETVHSVNRKDYTEKELDAWAPANNDYSHLKKALRENHSLLAVINGKIVGFGDIDSTGYLDHLFVHKEYQGKGIATMLCNELEKGYGSISVHASVTARPFFERRGYIITKEQLVDIRGEKLRNYVMEKQNIGIAEN